MKKSSKFILILALIGFLVYLWNRVLMHPMNSDGACMLLEAEDILSGNVFLSDWHLTGTTFYTTDLPWFVLSVAIFGVSLKAYQLAVFLMIAFMILSAMPLVFYKVKNKWTAALILGAIGLVPTDYAISNGFVHTAGFALCFLSVYFFLKYTEEGGKLNFTMLFLCTALACGDHGVLAFVTFPVALMCVLKAVKRPLWSAVSCVGGTAFGLLMEQLWLFAGGADFNQYYHCYFVETPGVIAKNFGLFIEYFLRLINSSFFTKELFSVKTAVFGVKILICLFGLYLMARSIVLLIKRKSCDTATAVLGTGFWLMFAMIILATFTTDVTTGRYVAYLPLALSIVLARNISEFNFDDVKLSAICGVCLLLLSANLLPHGSDFSPYNRYSELAEFLKQNNLNYGYASFWDSSAVTVYSENDVKVRSIRYENEILQPRIWFCKNSWYEGGQAEFVIIRDEGDRQEQEKYTYNGIYTMRLNDAYTYGVTYDNVVSALGLPDSEKKFKNYTILVYDKIELENVK